jgi:hypothetical protein
MGSAYALDNIAGQKSDDGHVWVGGFAARMEPDGTHTTPSTTQEVQKRWNALGLDP